MSTINFTGLTGFDTQAIVDALMKVERQPLEKFQQEQAVIQTKRNIYSDISSKLSSLQSSITKLTKEANLNAKSVNSSDSDVISATATAYAQTGTFTISEISSLATKHSESFLGISDKQTQFESGTFFNFEVNGTSYSIDVAALSADEQNLEGLRDAINSEAGDDVTAIILNTGDADDPFKLSIQSNSTGEENQIINISTDVEVTTSAGTASLATVGSEQVLGTDATFTFNGVEISRSSNTVDDLLEGLTIKLKQESTTAVELNVVTDSDSVQDDIQGFIDDYNALNKIIQQQFTYNEDAGRAGILSGDSTLRQIQSQLQGIVVSGVTDADGNRYSLGSIGIDIDKKTGNLSIDQERFDEALASGDKQLLLDVFATVGTPENDSVRYVRATDETTAGTYNIDISSNDGSSDVVGTFTINGTTYDGVGEGQFLLGKEGTPAEGLKVEIDSGVTGDLGDLYLSIGVGKQLAETISSYTQPFSGLLAKLDSTFEQELDSINDQIDAFELRLVERERILTNQFLAAEQAISELQAQQSAFQSQAAQL